MLTIDKIDCQDILSIGGHGTAVNARLQLVCSFVLFQKKHTIVDIDFPVPEANASFFRLFRFGLYGISWYLCRLSEQRLFGPHA